MIGILISTFDKNEPLAHWTAEQIDQQWRNHPPMFFSGLTSDHPQHLGFTGNPADWMDVTLQAVKAMRVSGFSYAYLILDDHPPVGRCHEKFLNQQLPALAKDLNAVYIGLLGYGQHRSANGKILSQQEGFLESCAGDYRWKFSLHPGLWNLEKLELLLEKRKETYSVEARTAWNFEVHRDHPNDPIVGPMMGQCFRIKGSYFLKKKLLLLPQLLIEKAERFIADVVLYGAKIAGGIPARNAVEKKLLWRYGHYLGPYPLFWSGTMQRGQPHQGFEQWLRRLENRRLRKAWEKFKQAGC